MLAMGVFHVDIDVVASGGGDAERHYDSLVSLPSSVLEERRL